MKERPILMSAPMVRALLAGTKTQTRRVVKPARDPNIGCWMTPGEIALDSQTVQESISPYGRPGDRLWVKEQTIKVEDHGWIGPVYTESNAGQHALEWGYGESDDPDHIPPHAIKRRSSVFMPRAMSRITLEVIDVRVERLQDISEADATAEGVTAKWEPGCSGRLMEALGGFSFRPAASAYADLWEQLNGPGSWDANPFVWVISFRRLEQEAP